MKPTVPPASKRLTRISFGTAFTASSRCSPSWARAAKASSAARRTTARSRSSARGREAASASTARARGYGGKATGEKGETPVGAYDGYRPLVVEIVKFFRTGKPPVSAEETLEIYAFMEAADESKRQGGAEVMLENVLQKARKAAGVK